jgi:hypothetical protein
VPATARLHCGSKMLLIIVLQCMLCSASVRAGACLVNWQHAGLAAYAQCVVLAFTSLWLGIGSECAGALGNNAHDRTGTLVAVVQWVTPVGWASPRSTCSIDLDVICTNSKRMSFWCKA